MLSTQVPLTRIGNTSQDFIYEFNITVQLFMKDYYYYLFETIQQIVYIT